MLKNKKQNQNEHLEILTKDILQLDGTLAHSPSPDLFKQRLTLQTCPQNMLKIL